MTTQTDLEYLDALDRPQDDDPTRSLIDLIDGGTADLDLAAFLVAKVAAGASYITGSGPGGIGKTTTMHSLLSFVPAGRPFFTALPGKVADIGQAPAVAISNELSDHPPPTYLWGDDLRAFLALADQGHILVANVHADDLDEIHGQIVGDNAVPESQFRAVNLLIFICLEGGNPPERRIRDNTTRRIVDKVYYSDGSHKHRLIYRPDTGLTADAPRDPAREKSCRAFLEEALNGDIRRHVDLRRRFLKKI